MIQTKREEWEQACSDYPELSPFTLLKLSMVRYGAEPQCPVPASGSFLFLWQGGALWHQL